MFEIDELYKGNYYCADCGTDSPYAEFDDESIAEHITELLRDFVNEAVNEAFAGEKANN
jgi:hypothetical protein